MKALLVSLVLLAACQQSSSNAPASTPAPAPAPAPIPTHEALPPGHPAIPTAQPGAPSASANEGPANAGGLTWEGVAPLVRRTPKSSMRAAEYGVEGDEHAELSVFYFGEGAAGGVEANVTRWLGQFAQPDGSDTTKKAKRSTIKASGIDVSLVEVTGTFAGGMGMGMPSAAPATDYALLGAIASGPQGAVFFKLTGPQAAVERARAAFTKMIGSLHPAS